MNDITKKNVEEGSLVSIGAFPPYARTKRQQLDDLTHENHQTYYFTSYDLFACVDCDMWLSAPCTCGPQDDCPFTPPPARPSLANQGRREDVKRIMVSW
jgi:hypothetical protein